MPLVDKFWITPQGSFEMGHIEHMDFAIAVMLAMPSTAIVPRWWAIRGIPPTEIEAALDRGADQAAVRFLENKRNDARMWAMREYGWIRTAKNAWNLWDFDKATADMVRNSTDYWKFQASRGHMTEYEMLDIYEFKTGDQFSINARKLLAGGNPKVLKNLAMGVADEIVEKVEPVYSTAKFSELERRTLAGRTGDNPRKRHRK